jgi:DNA-directed RNA polymerase subunit L
MSTSSSASFSSDKQPVEVPRLTIRTIAVKAEEELRELTGLSSLPFVSAMVKMEIKGVPTAVANSLRRVLCDEMRGRCLIASKAPTTTGSSDPFMMDQFVQNRISMIALRARISDEIIRNVRFAIDVRNDTTSVMTVFSGDLKVTAGRLNEPIFDPTYEIAIVQPGQVYRVEDIHIEEGYGRDFAAYQVCVQTFLRHLDLREVPKTATHSADGAACDMSGYEESSLVANPRHHVVGFTVSVVPKGDAGIDDVKTVLIDACKNIKERIQLVQGALASVQHETKTSSTSSTSSGGGVSFTLIDLESGLSEGILKVRGETHTIGNLLARSIYETTPDVSFCSYKCAPHESEMRLTVRHIEDVPGVVQRAAQQAYATFDGIQHRISAIKPGME